MKFWTKLSVILIFLILMESCRKDDAVLKSAGTLGFSEDTLLFDTVFTRLPGTAYPRSINKRFMIRNPYKETVFVNARVMGGSASSYRFNVDGRFGKEIADIEILPKDSAWVMKAPWHLHCRETPPKAALLLARCAPGLAIERHCRARNGG